MTTRLNELPNLRGESAKRAAAWLVISLLLLQGIAGNSLLAYRLMTTPAAHPPEATIGNIREEDLSARTKALSTVRPPSRLIAVGEDTIVTYRDLRRALLTSRAGPIQLKFADAPPVSIEIPVTASGRLALYNAIEPIRSSDPVIRSVVPGGPADLAGLKQNDRVISADGRAVTGFQQLIGVIEQSEGESLMLTIARQSDTLNVRVFAALASHPNGVAVKRIGITGPPVGEITGGRWELERSALAAFALAILSLLVLAGLSIALMWKTPHRPDCRLLSLWLAAIVAGSTAISGVGLFAPGISPWSTAILAIPLIAAPLRFAALFPRPLTDVSLRRPKTPPRRQRAGPRVSPLTRFLTSARTASLQTGHDVLALLINYRRALLKARYAWLTSAIIAVLGLAATAAASVRLATIGTFISTVHIAGEASVYVIAVSFLWTSYKSAGRREQAAILWLLMGAIMIPAALILFVVPAYLLGYAGHLLQEESPLTLSSIRVLFAFALFMAVFYRGELDPALVIRRTAVYSALAVIGVALFAAAEGVVGELVEDRLGLPPMVNAALSGSIVALLVVVFRRSIRRASAKYLAKSGTAVGASASGQASSQGPERPMNRADQ